MENIRRTVAMILLAILLVWFLFYGGCEGCNSNCSYDFPSYSENHPPPAGTPANEIFSLSQNYPETFDADEAQPWAAISFIENPHLYAQAVLDYCLEGNIAVDFRGQDNAVRKWYHTPWLHYGEFGREFRHGLTRERSSRPNELHPNQNNPAFTWAVGMYNAKGGYTIGKVWDDCGKKPPTPKEGDFPMGTVTFKLLFTSATNAQVPYLRNGFSWMVNTGPINNEDMTPDHPDWRPRSDRNMRLLQIDIAVKDDRSPIDWVFGTFVYDGYKAGATPWDRFQLVGLSWGNDPGVTARKNEEGVFINEALTESYINPNLIGDPNVPVNEAKMYHLGLGGRLNGPVDNPISACTSCHGKAANLKNLLPVPIDRIGWVPNTFERGKTVPEVTNFDFNDFFGTNIASGTDDIEYNGFISGFANSTSVIDTFVNTDYSLQTAIGIRNYYLNIYNLAEKHVEDNGGSRR